MSGAPWVASVVINAADHDLLVGFWSQPLGVFEDHEACGFAWKVMADPEGNEFCIAPSGAH